MKTEIYDLILNAGPIAKFVLSILALLSVVSWAIIFEKMWRFMKIRRSSNFVLEELHRGTNLKSLYEASLKFHEGPMSRVVMAFYQEGLDRSDGAHADRMEALARSMRRAISREISKMERFLPVLATTASASPFIGLFGTVWGVMESFRGIGIQGSASLAVVAPGISEALIATAAGLGAAIPAVMAYNFFVNRVKHWTREMEALSLQMLNQFGRLPILTEMGGERGVPVGAV